MTRISSNNNAAETATTAATATAATTAAAATAATPTTTAATATAATTPTATATPTTTTMSVYIDLPAPRGGADGIARRAYCKICLNTVSSVWIWLSLTIPQKAWACGAGPPQGKTSGGKDMPPTD